MGNASSTSQSPKGSTEKPPGNTPSYLMSPTWRFSPRNKASDLYDSFELQAVAKQLNRTIQGSNAPLSPYSRYLKSSPFYGKQLNQIWRQSANTPKKLSCSPQLEGTTKNTKEFILQLRRKVKRRLTRGKGKDSEFCG